MIGIDTNILVRYLTQDDKVQSEQATKLIDKYAGKSGTIFINNIVICELIWVLERGYKYSKSQVLNVLKEILTTLEFSFDDHKILWTSIIDYEKADADFSDILIGKLNLLNACSQTYSFDVKAAKLSTFTMVE